MNVCIYPMAECHFLSLGYLSNFTDLLKKIKIFTGKKYFTKPITELTPSKEASTELDVLDGPISLRLICRI